MDKKASEVMPLATVIEFILILIVVAMMATIISRETSSTKFEKRFLAQDIAMFIDTLYASPNDLVVRYPQDFDYNIVFDMGKVTVYEESVSDGEYFSFTEDPNIEFQYKTVSDNTLIFIKTSTKITPLSGEFVEEIE